VCGRREGGGDWVSFRPTRPRKKFARKGDLFHRPERNPNDARERAHLRSSRVAQTSRRPRRRATAATRENTGNVKKAIKIFAVGNTGALFLGPQTAEREMKGHCTKKHIIPHLALGLNGLALAATLL
jgi:hypothetical protein